MTSAQVQPTRVPAPTSARLVRWGRAGPRGRWGRGRLTGLAYCILPARLGGGGGWVVRQARDPASPAGPDVGSAVCTWARSVAVAMDLADARERIDEERALRWIRLGNWRDRRGEAAGADAMPAKSDKSDI